MTADDVKRALGLVVHPREGGWFARSYTSGAVLPAVALARTADPVEFDGPRRLSTAIYYLLETGTFSEMHRLKSDEIFHHYAGDPVEMVLLHGSGEVERHVLGKDLDAGQRPQFMVPHGTWQGARLLAKPQAGDAWALLGCTVSPGFEYADYEAATRHELLSRWPEARETIMALTREGVR